LCFSINNRNFAAHFEEEVKELNQYDIDIYGLKEKQYDYDFESGSTFFKHLEQELIEDGYFKVHLTIDKSSTMLMLHFHIVGSIQLVCDRSLETFEEPIDIKERLILKYSDHDEELSEEIQLIRQDTTRINVAEYVFEFIALTIPMKKLHPRFRTDDDEDFDEDEGFLVYQSSDEDDTEKTNNEDIDPRWAALSKLKGK